MKNSDVVIVGGGAVGCATAYFLAKEGIDVVLLEKESVACAASGYAMGLLSPFASSDIPAPLVALSLNGFLMHRDLAGELRQATGIDYHAHAQDSIYLAGSDQEITSLETIAYRSSQVDGITHNWLDGTDIVKLEPRISKSMTKGLIVQGAWLLEAYNYTQALYVGAQKYGAQFYECEVSGLKACGNQIEIETNGDNIQANTVVLAMGPWTGMVEEWLKVPVPVYPLKGQILRMDLPGPTMNHSLHHNSNYAGPKADGLVWIGTTEERVGFDDQISHESRNQIIRDVATFLPSVLDGNLVRQTACLRPVTPDGLPIIGQVPGWDNVYLSTGAGRKGIILSPSMGIMTANLVLGKDNKIPLDIFSPERFT